VHFATLILAQLKRHSGLPVIGDVRFYTKEERV